ncbi:nucleobase-ascorbate transporter 11 isoform X2 [Diospyros lotus]|uniref:nucleobase-ascorbate transporter 11 isoform X2 n=1 Tax=Diospyros lotus TaxID=55363 RepID=UPI00224F1764|nr:nucleobase-ascorbate transporter 11 isoform X2 [Diospyros lotus]
MEGGSRSEAPERRNTQKGQKLGSVLPGLEPFVPRKGHDPKELRSWAKRTGFVSDLSGESHASVSQRAQKDNTGSSELDLEKGLEKHGSSSPKIEIDPVLGRTRHRGIEIEPVLGAGRGAGRNGNGGDLGIKDGRVRGENQRRNGAEFSLGARDEESRVGLNGNGVVNGAGQRAPAAEPMKDDRNVESEEGIDDAYQDGGEPGPGGWSPGMKLGLRDNPGVVPLMYYGLQHYLSLAGSLIFIPLVIVPAMGGTDKDTATVISTMLLVSGITTILHLYFGTRLPLVQGSSFVYLAPLLVIVNSEEIRNLTEHKFRHIMRELQGAIIIGSIFQSFLGFSGLMSLLVRLVNPVVVAPTVAAVGLAFFSYGFPQAGSCVEISLPQILLVLIFTLVPLSVILIWAYAFFLTAGGAYNYKGCSPDIPSSNILIDACRRHAYTMKHCRTDVSNAWRTAAWVRVPYPLQWGIPVFRLRTSLMMIMVSLVASVDSVGTYHITSVRINSKPPTLGVVSRGVGMEGFCSALAGLWGTGSGSTTLTENVHTINVTKIASRRAVEIGAVFLIFFSFIGKVGAILASIPQALAAAVLCFIWALIVALGLSNLHYCQTGSFRNMTIVGVSLFLGLSIPAYFQQYQPDSSLILPSYFVPFATASHGPFHSGSEQFDFAVNGLLSLNMVVTLLVALLLDNTVPGSRQERGTYIWSGPEDMTMDPLSLSDYHLPEKVARFFHCPKCLS